MITTKGANSAPPIEIPTDLLHDAIGGDPAAMNDLWHTVKRYGFRFFNNRKYMFSNDCSVTIDDLEQAAAQAFMNAVHTYKDGHDAAFLTWYTYHLKSTMKHLLHGAHGDAYMLPEIALHAYLDEPVPDTDDLTLLDTVAGNDESPQDAAERVEGLETLRAAINALDDPRQRSALTRHYIDGESIEHLEQEMGIPRRSIEKVMQAGCNRLRNDQSVKDYGAAYRKVSIAEFIRTGLSVTELAAFPELRHYTDQGDGH